VTKLRFVAVLLIAAVGAYVFAVAAIVATGMSDGGGFG
jgi:hypothetical protein